MGKQHDTFPEEKPEMPVSKERPEINQPSEPEVPQELPDEYPAENNPPEAPGERPGII